METVDSIGSLSGAVANSAHVSAHSVDAVETATSGPDVHDGVRSALDSLGLGTDPSMNASRTLERSERFWRAVEPVKRDLLERVRQDAGSQDDASETLLGLQDAYCEVRLFRTAMFVRLSEGPNPGPVTGKGRTKALFTAYLAALDRETKLAQALGLARRAKAVPTVADLLERA
jgi:hypothetical protein